MTMRLDGKVALVTGAASGIGYAISERFVREGATVVLTDVDAERVRKKALMLSDDAIHMEMDVTKLESIKNTVGFVCKRFGNLDVLVNSAGAYQLGDISAISEDDYQGIFDVNVKGLVFVVKEFSTIMRQPGKRGKIINMASLAGRRGTAQEPLYCASKAAVISLTQSFALDFAKKGINVNAISPGLVDTEMFMRLSDSWAKLRNKSREQMVSTIVDNIPIGYIADASDIADCAVWLASNESDYVIGQTINVDGGKWMS